MLRATILFLLLTCGLFAQTKTKPDPIVGEWKGTSQCVIKDSPCRDETASYIFSPGDKSGQYKVDGGKVVNGERVSMGMMECHFDSAANTLTCGDPQRPGPKVELTLKDDTLNGTFTLADGRVLRRINLSRGNVPVK